MIDADDVPVVAFTQADTIRLISTAYIDEPAIAPLVDGDDEFAFLEHVEGLTSARRDMGLPLPSGVVADELLTERDCYGWTYVNAAFCYTRSTGNRFNGPDRGAWYAAWGRKAVKTAHTEIGWHLTQELKATGIYENLTSYRELVAGFTCNMHDLRGFEGDEVFAKDPTVCYPKGQALAQSIREAGGQGVIYPSVRQAAGLCLAAFRPRLVQNIRQGNTWFFEWNGKPEPTISKSI